MIELNSRYTVAKDVLFRELEGEMVLLDTRSATYFSLNETGSEVWQRLCQEMAKTYNLPQDKLMADLTRLLEDLLNACLIQPNS